MFNETLEHVTDYYVIFVVIDQFACFAQQIRGFLAGKTSALTIHDKDDAMICHVF